MTDVDGIRDVTRKPESADSADVAAADDEKVDDKKTNDRRADKNDDENDDDSETAALQEHAKPAVLHKPRNEVG